MIARGPVLHIYREITPESVAAIQGYGNLAANELGLEDGDFQIVRFTAGIPVVGLFAVGGHLAKEIAADDIDDIRGAATETATDTSTVDISGLLSSWGWDLQKDDNRLDMSIKRPTIELKDVSSEGGFSAERLAMGEPAWNALTKAISFARHGQHLGKGASKTVNKKILRSMPVIGIHNRIRQEEITSAHFASRKAGLNEAIPTIEVGPVKVDFFEAGDECLIDFGEVGWEIG